MTKKLDLKVPFGLKNNQLVHVSDVESGLKCGCSCPACGHPLEARNIARKERKKVYYFAHHEAPQCKYAFETALHMAAKKVIEEAGYIILPKLECEIVNGRKRLLFKETKVYYDKIYLEKRFHDIVPDVIIQKDGHQLCIEIFVTHEVDEEKRKKIEMNKLSAVEIDLSRIDRAIDFESLKASVVDSIHNKKWLFNSMRCDLHKKILNNSIAKEIWTGSFPRVLGCPIKVRIQEAKLRERVVFFCDYPIPASVQNEIALGLAIHFDDCPPTNCKDKPYAEVDECRECFYYVRPIDNDVMVHCIGHKSKEELTDLLNMHKLDSRSSEENSGGRRTVVKLILD